MNTYFRSMEAPALQLITYEISNKGSACIANFLTSDQLKSLKESVRAEAEKHKGSYFAHHGGSEIESSLLGALGASPEFRNMLESVYQAGAGQAAYSNEILKVLRCVQGTSGRRESNCFHYDASLVTALLPIEIPQDGVDRGAALQTGGRARADLGSPLFFEPTVLTDVARDSRLNLEETFGPVVPLVRVGTDDEIIELANRNTLGLVSSVFTTDLRRAFRFAEAIRTGIVNINDTSNYWELHIPFGGMSGKKSGIGRLGGKHTLMAMTDLKTVCIDIG